MGYSLRPYQSEALRESKTRLDAGVCNQLLVLPTGAGKTICFAALPEHHGIDGKKTLVIVHRKELAKQAADKIGKCNGGYSVGVEMGDSHSHPYNDVVVASVQSIGNAKSPRLLQFTPSDFGAIIVDEAHHSTGESYKNIFRHFGVMPGARDGSNRLLLGVTATPNRPDGLGLGAIYDEIIYNYPMLDAIKDGWLCMLRGIRIRTHASLDSVGTALGDFKQDELGKAVDTPARNELLVKEWLRLGEDRQTIAFTVDIAHAKNLANMARDFNIKAEAIWGDDPDRAAKLAAHRKGDLQWLANCNVLTEGYDDWTVQCIIHGKPTKSQLSYTQMTGRGTRIPEGIANLNEAIAAGIVPAKTDCLVLDAVDNCGKHSLVTLASLFGMPAKLNMNGKPITEAIDMFNAASSSHPNADLSNTEEDIENLVATAEEVDLFTVSFPTEVVENSKLQWHKTPHGNYVMLLPEKGKYLSITRDLLDKYHVEGGMNGTSFNEQFTDIGEAFAFGDRVVKRFGNNIMSMLRRDSKVLWRNAPCTEKQMNYITLKMNKLKSAVPDFRKMTSGDAMMLINKLIVGCKHGS